MTKIFEALENAGMERYSLREEQERVLPLPDRQKDEAPQVRYTAPATRTTAHTETGTASSLYQSITMLLPGKESRIVQFQSTHRGEGTSTLIREVAALAAIKLKKKVLLLDLNQKAPNQCSFFGVRSQLPPLDSSSPPNLSRKDFAQVDSSSLYVTQLPAQGIPASIICEMPQMGPLLESLKNEFDLVLIDSPAAVSCAECLMLSPKVDGVVLVVQAEKTRWQTVDKVKEQILAQNGNILGVVLNKRQYPIPEFIYKRI